MKRVNVLGIVIIFSLLVVPLRNVAQSDGQNSLDDNRVLFTVAGENIIVSEFDNIYRKSNIHKEASYSDSSLREYLDLYVVFKLKVAQAKDLKYDTVSSIIAELENYRKQVARNYLTDKEVTAKLVDEAYNRHLTEIRASHILIRVSPNASPEDSLAAYNKILEVRKLLMSRKVKKSGGFATVAAEFSEDPTAKENGGDLGFFTGLQMVYTFENMAYNTKVGRISQPFRTRFGYHVLKVTDTRPSQGKMYTAHIFINVPRGSTDDQKLKFKDNIDQIYLKLQAGQSFKELAELMSDDKTTAKKGGDFLWFGTGEMFGKYELAAFSLENDGDYTEPVQTPLGWYIIKRLERKDLPSFKEMRQELKSRIAQDSRAGIAKSALIKRIKKDNSFTEFKPAFEQLLERVDSTLIYGRWIGDKAADLNKPLFTLLDESYSQHDFSMFMEQNTHLKVGSNVKTIFNNYYVAYVEQSCISFEEDRLEKRYPEFRNLMKEYFDGILLFEITDDKIWSRASKDTAGLNSFFENHQYRYMWNERIRANIFACKNQEVADGVKADVNNRMDAHDMEHKYNEGHQAKNLDVEQGVYERGQNNYIDGIIWKMGWSQNKVLDDGKVIMIKVTGILDPETKQLNETRGQVIADYQEYLEKEWVKFLRDKYNVVIDEDVFKSLIK
ncbi:MAG: peptidylprolyl isomerase [Bacteroidetes bacterium]|nr:peptidylprolyl isomerase [Bacteroidota bacterium]